MELATLLYTDEIDGIPTISEYDDWKLYFGKNTLFLLVVQKPKRWINVAIALPFI
jgi:hypothetical protein